MTGPVDGVAPPVQYLTPDRRVHAAAGRSALVRTLRIEQIDLLFTTTSQRPLTVNFDPGWGDARETLFGRARYQSVQVHSALHVEISACHTAGLCRNQGTAAGPLAGLCFDVLTATDLTGVADLIERHSELDLPLAPGADQFEEHRVRRNRTLNRTSTTQLLRWIAGAAACAGYIETCEMDAFWDLTVAISELTRDQTLAAMSLAETWTATAHELISTITAVTP